MTVANFFKDVFTGNFQNAWKRVMDWLGSEGVPSWAVNLIDKLGTQEGTILVTLVGIAATEILTDGLSTAGFVLAAKDILGKLIAQNITTFTLQDIFAALNSAVSSHPDNPSNQNTPTLTTTAA